MRYLYIVLLCTMFVAIPRGTGPLANPQQVNNRAMHGECEGKVSATEGSCAPNFSLTDRRGRSFDLASLSGKLVLLHFWATWCEPCKEELPVLEALQRNLGKGAFHIVTVSLDEDEKALREFFKARGFTLPVLLDAKRRASTLYGTIKVPESFLIGQDGRILDKVVGSWYWDNSMTRHYFQCLLKSNEQKESKDCRP